MNRRSNARVATVVYIIMLIISGLLLSVPPGDLPFYIIMLGLAIFILKGGSKTYTIWGIVAVLLSLMLIAMEITAGVRIKHFRQERSNKQNSITASTNIAAHP